MVNKGKLSKDVEEQIQSLASDVYIQIEDKLTKLISSAIEIDSQKDVSKQNDAYATLEKSYKTSQLELSEQIDVSNNQSQKFEQEINALKNTLAETQSDLETNKQNFQVELTQNSINFNETIEELEKKILNLQQEKTNQQSKQQVNGVQLEEKLLEKEQALKESKKQVDGLNGRISVLTDQEKSLVKQLNALKESQGNEDNKLKATLENLQQTNKEQAEMLVKKQQALEETIEKLNASTAELEKVQKESQESSETKVKEILEQVKKLEEQLQQEKESKQTIEKDFTEQLKQEQSNKVTLQQDLTALQKDVDTQKDQSQQLVSKNKISEETIAQLKETLVAEQQKHVEEKEAIASQGQEAKQLQTAAQEAIIQLEKDKEQLTKQVETEQSDVKLYQQEVNALKEQLSVAQDGQENILQRFNANREKQEQDNEKVRETIKFLRDENHDLLSAHAEQNTQLTEKINELEHKLTEYRLKFEYAQKQLAN